MVKKFIRRTWGNYSKLGRRRKKKQIWKSPKGRHNKMREKRKGYPSVVSVGYKKEKKYRFKIDGKKPKIIMNLKGLQNIKENEILIMGNIGRKKKLEIVKKAKEKKLSFKNLNIEKFIKKNEISKIDEKKLIEDKIHKKEQTKDNSTKEKVRRKKNELR